MGNTTYSSITVQWTNLTTIIRRQVRNYIIIVNITNGSTLAHKVTNGSQLAIDITGLMPSEIYTVEVFGVDNLGQTYKSLAVNATTKNSKNIDSSELIFVIVLLACSSFLSIVLQHLRKVRDYTAI